MNRIFTLILFFLLLVISGCVSSPDGKAELLPIRTVQQWEQYREQGLVPERVERIYCSGGTLRLVVYMECTDRVVATDGNERIEKERLGMKAYLAAHPELHDLPIAGESSGRDHPERLLGLSEPPQVIIKADTGAGYDPRELTRRTGIPVVLIPMRGITVGREEFDSGLRLLGAVLGKNERAEALIEFFDREIADLKRRSEKAISANPSRPLVYVGGVSYNGSHGFHSTEAGYPSLELVGAKVPITKNTTDPLLGNRHTMLSKEAILQWDPEVMFLDLGTLNLGSMSGLHELRSDPSYRSLTAVKKGNVHALLPNTFYFVNHDAVLANAWFAGKTLYPEEFADVEPAKKADEIFTFLVGKPVFRDLDSALQNLLYKPLPLN